VKQLYAASNMRHDCSRALTQGGLMQSFP
jgi:hypothetical protein